MFTYSSRSAVLMAASAVAVLIVASIAATLHGAEEHLTPMRSAIPQPGETFKTPIPPTRLSNDGLPEVESGDAEVSHEPAPPRLAPVVPWTLAGQHVGKTITAEGKVVDTHSGKVCFLNFADNREGFYVVIFEEAINSFPEPPAKYFMHKTIRVTGEVYMHGGRPQIRVTDPKQIVIVP